MEITVSSRNPIIRFMHRVRYLTSDDCHRPFPDDICKLTREFLLYVLLYVFVTALAGLEVIFMALWPVALLHGFHFAPDSGAGVLIAFGALGWIALFVTILVWLRLKAKSYGLIREDGTVARFSASTGERIRHSLAAEMWRSLKDKTCVRVRVDR